MAVDSIDHAAVGIGDLVSLVGRDYVGIGACQVGGAKSREAQRKRTEHTA